MTPEESKALELLRWMISHPPNLATGDRGITNGRRRVLKTLLSRLRVTPSGCIIHPGRADTHPAVYWPSRDGRQKRAIQPAESEALPIKKTATHRLIIELWFPSLDVPGVTQPTCRVRRCVNPQHRVKATMGAILTGYQTGWQRKLTADEAREICRLRLYGSAGDSVQIAEKFGVSRSMVGKIARGEIWTEETQDLRAEKEYASRAVPMSAYLEACQFRLDNPDMSATEISKRTGIAKDRVGLVLKGRIFADLTEHLRCQPDFDPTPPRYRKGRNRG